MADIATILVPCYVVQLNNQQFLYEDNIIGQILQVPCRNALIDDVPYWAVPIKDSGIFTGLDYILSQDNNQVPVTAPTFDSFLVTRVRDKISSNVWWIYVNTKNDFVNACSSCCGSAFTPTPIPPGGFIQIAPCQLLCQIQNSAGAYQAIFGIPNLIGHEAYYPYGSYNNVALAAASGSGYATVGAMVAFMNANWTNIGSPNTTFIWTATADGLTLTATGGFLNDSLCVSIVTVGTSS